MYIVFSRESPGASDASTQSQDGNYVPMTPLTSSLTAPPVCDMAVLGRQVPPPAHMGFRTPPLRWNAANTAGEVEREAVPPPIHRNLKPQRRGNVG